MTLINYHNILNKNNIKLDYAQEQILSELTKLNQNIIEYNNSNKNILKKIIKRSPIPTSIYLYGGTGTGKTMLADLFFDNLKLAKKRKIHFHSFMLEVHNFMHKFKDNPLKTLAKDLKKKYKILYIDELYINDITDAMIVSKLFNEILNQNIVVIITSNFAPEDLYKDGLQRDSFIPFIELIKEKMQILKINSEYDYRTHKLKSIKTYYYRYKDIKDSQEFILKCFKDLSKNAPTKSVLLNNNSRKLFCPITASDCVNFTFNELCRKPLATSDYILICKNFHVILISEIPELKPSEHNELRRFIHLIDTIYEYKRLLICSAETDIDDIYKSGKWHFEFQRTASRLKEMQSEDYWIHKT